MLRLVLDLDHTIVHSVEEDRLTAEEQQQLPALQAEQAALPQEQRTLFHLKSLPMHIKFRPGAFEFVQAAAQFFELWIFTNGCRYSHPESSHHAAQLSPSVHYTCLLLEAQKESVTSRSQCISALQQTQMPHMEHACTGL